MKIISISWIINITNIFNISEEHHKEHRAQKFITTFFGNKLFGHIIKNNQFFYREDAYKNMCYTGVYITNQAKWAKNINGLQPSSSSKIVVHTHKKVETHI
jgi:hypothetical protein